jgi:glycine cleavage system H lipoate-binding protein
VSGEIVEVNTMLTNSPQVLNSDAENTGWIVKIALSDASETEKLLDSDGYAELTL